MFPFLPQPLSFPLIVLFLGYLMSWCSLWLQDICRVKEGVHWPSGPHSRTWGTGSMCQFPPLSIIQDPLEGRAAVVVGQGMVNRQVGGYIPAKWGGRYRWVHTGAEPPNTWHVLHCPVGTSPTKHKCQGWLLAFQDGNWRTMKPKWRTTFWTCSLVWLHRSHTQKTCHSCNRRWRGCNNGQCGFSDVLAKNIRRILGWVWFWWTGLVQESGIRSLGEDEKWVGV